MSNLNSILTSALADVATQLYSADELTRQYQLLGECLGIKPEKAELPDNAIVAAEISEEDVAALRRVRDLLNKFPV